MGDIFTHSIKINDNYTVTLQNKKSNVFTSSGDLARWLYINNHRTPDTASGIVIKKQGTQPSIVVDDMLSLASTNPVQNKVITNAINVVADSIPSPITIDNVLSTTSANPVENKVITSAIKTIQEKKLYLHTVKLGVYGEGYLFTNIITNNSAPYTFSTFAKWLYDNNYNDSGTAINNNNNRYPCSGAGSSESNIQSISSSNGTSIRVYWGSYMQSVKNFTSATTFVDHVALIG